MKAARSVNDADVIAKKIRCTILSSRTSFACRPDTGNTIAIKAKKNAKTQFETKKKSREHTDIVTPIKIK